MNDIHHHYKARPLGEQLSAHFARRAELRRSIPLFSISLSRLAKCFEADTRHTDERLHRATGASVPA